jgi:3-hydroxybutyryl-CoA dehydratase
MSSVTGRRLGQGYFWQDLTEGARFQTFRRTITETDLVNFISVTGMLEEIFIDVTHDGGAVGGRLVPAALTYSLIEGMLLTTMIQGTGLALLEASMKVTAPVRVGDTVDAEVIVLSVRPTSRKDRAIVVSRVAVSNQDGAQVLTYDVTRMLAGDPACG